jgi:alpha-L-rhamnosidase
VAGSGSYDNILIAPEIIGDLTWAETTFSTIHGEIASYWKIDGNNLILKVKIPVSCKAVIAIPQVDPGKITENDKPIRDRNEIKIIKETDGKTMCEISSGEYLFKTSYIK